MDEVFTPTTRAAPLDPGHGPDRHQTTDLAVGGSNPSRRATITAAQRPYSGVAGCRLGIGMLPAGQDAAEAFYRVIDAAYERRSVAVTSNIHPSGFDQIMPKTLATATVDRLLHHAHLIVTKGDSHRLAEALTGKGVVPLS